MHFVAALDDSEMRAVLTLFEGVATGAADGYARMADKPAATLLHLGCGLGNGLANLHNTRKADVSMVNIIGDHATYHTRYEVPLQSDIEIVARNNSTWTRTCSSSKQLAADVAEAVQVITGIPTRIATLIIPADVSWGQGSTEVETVLGTKPDQAPDHIVNSNAEALNSRQERSDPAQWQALRQVGLLAASKIAEKTGAKLFCEGFPTRLERGVVMTVDAGMINPVLQLAKKTKTAKL